MSQKEYVLDDFNFNLPDELIAQYPVEKRDDSRLLYFDKNINLIKHKKFFEIPEFLNNNDILIFNDAKVINARVFFKRQTGGIVEIILIQKNSFLSWLVISNKTKKLQIGEKLYAINNNEVYIVITGRINEFLEIESNIELSNIILDKIGSIPLPPYIRRDSSRIDNIRYQTVYAHTSGAIAAPTAGLHFTENLLEILEKKGVECLFVTLDVSWGTFQPVRCQNLKEHIMHTEKYSLSEETAIKINNGRAKGKRIIAVGTTSLRVLESTYFNGENKPGRGETNIFIYPPYIIKSIDALITNFHTPYSTLLMLVAAFTGFETIMNVYNEAINLKYRFFSYGDSMFIC